MKNIELETHFKELKCAIHGLFKYSRPFKIFYGKISEVQNTKKVLKNIFTSTTWLQLAFEAGIFESSVVHSNTIYLSQTEKNNKQNEEQTNMYYKERRVRENRRPPLNTPPSCPNKHHEYQTQHTPCEYNKIIEKGGPQFLIYLINLYNSFYV